MFVCSNCKEDFDLPKCNSCGYSVEKQDGVWQLSDDPDIVIEGESDKYIGYEYIGESYNGNRKYLIEEKDYKFGKEIARLTRDGIFLDLGCGDGCLTVPVASFGTKVIAADISNTMIKILMNKANINNVYLDNITLCRLNALNIPIAHNSVDCVAANSVFHLLSNPEKVIGEIHRVLKPDGVFVCKDDTPGKDTSKDYKNEKYKELVNNMYSQYWMHMETHNVFPKKYSWKFDRDAVCRNIFRFKETFLIKHNKAYSIMIKDSFIPRLFTRGFSDQVAVPKDVHELVIRKLYSDFKQRYGEDFDLTPYIGIENDIIVTIYIK